MTLLGIMLTPTTAEARKGVVIYQKGEQIFDAGSLPESVPVEDDGWRAGYRCQAFGLFWAIIHTWDCVPVAYTDAGYVDDQEVQAAIAAQYSQADISLGGFWARNGRWFMGGALLLMVVAGILGVVMGSDDDEEEEDEDEEEDSLGYHGAGR